MELGLDFDDSFFTEKVRQKPTLTSYNAKVCYPKWFLSEEADNGRNDMATMYKFRGDYQYQSKDIESAIQSYKSSLDNLNTHNRTMRRELMESLARCSMQIGQFEESQQYTESVMTDCLTLEHYCQVLLLQQQLYRCSGALLREVNVLHQLVSVHSDNPHFWLKLADVYEKIRAHIQSASTCIKSDSTRGTYQDQNIVKFHTKGGNATSEDNTSRENTDIVTVEEVKNCLCTKNTGIYEPSKDCSSPVGCKDPDVNKCTVDKQQSGDSNEVREEQTSRCIGRFNEILSAYPIDLILLTCYIRTRLKLLSVQGTVGSFIKDKNTQLMEMIDGKIRDLSVKDSTIDQVTQFIKHDMTDDDAGEEDSRPDQTQDVKVLMENKITAEDFNNRWFSWIKEIS